MYDSSSYRFDIGMTGGLLIHKVPDASSGLILVARNRDVMIFIFRFLTTYNHRMRSPLQTHCNALVSVRHSSNFGIEFTMHFAPLARSFRCDCVPNRTLYARAYPESAELLNVCLVSKCQYGFYRTFTERGCRGLR